MKEISLAWSNIRGNYQIWIDGENTNIKISDDKDLKQAYRKAARVLRQLAREADMLTKGDSSA